MVMAELNIEKIAHDIAEKAIQELKNNGVLAGRWIPVSERLPSENGCYLVSTTGANNDIIDIAYYTKEIWHKASHIKAWMPLPEPYRAESEDNENVHQV